MGKFVREKPRVTGAVTSTEPALTHERGVGYARDPKSELFLLAVTNMVGEQTFYEAAGDRDTRYQALIGQVVAEDPSWVAAFVPYLRNTMQMRSASLVMAAEYIRAKGPNGRTIVSAALSRADEPGEMLAYWMNRYGRNLPAALKRGVADAVVRLYTERAALRYDGQARNWRMGDVIELVHPKPQAAWQSALFDYLLTARHGRKELRLDILPAIKEDTWLQSLPADQRADKVYQAGKSMSWERLSGWLGGPMDARAWEAVIPSMGYMALLRNLRNFEQAGVAPAVLQTVSMRLANEEEVSGSRQFPIRFFSAWKASGSMTFGPALERALTLSLANVPSLPGRTLVLVDCSGSMFGMGMSDRSKVSRHELAGVFGTALAMRAESADLYAYGTQVVGVPFQKTGSVLRIVEGLRDMGGTQTGAAVRHTFRGHDRIVLLTDEQAWYDAQGVRPAGVRFYTFNLAGYKVGHAESGVDGAYTFGGLTDACFRMLPLLERGRSTGWPWE